MQKTHQIPRVVGRVISCLPTWPGSLFFVSTLNSIITPRLSNDVKEAMLFKQFRLVVSDAQLQFDFVYVKGGFVTGHSDAQPDLTITASAYDFYLLSKREEDPDTLFFSRRLIMEGNTELGLTIKNALDAMELNVIELLKTLPVQKMMSCFAKENQGSAQDDR